MDHLPKLTDPRDEALRVELLGSLLRFTQFFYELLTHREFIVDLPEGRESPQVSLCRAFTDAFNGKVTRTVINIEPGSGKSEICKNFVSWSMAAYPDSNFIYTSFSHELAAKHTYGIKEIMSHPMYRYLFGVRIKQDSSAKDHFTTEFGGCVYAAGSQGTIVGFNAGLPIDNRFSGSLIMDDMHNPNEVHSDTIRARVKENYLGTLAQRPRSPRVPQIFIGQRLREDDLPACLLEGYDGYKWQGIILPSLDENNHVLNPRVRPLEVLLTMKAKNPYNFAAQCQQNPLPAGGGIFKSEYFMTLDMEPEIFATFITVDTAETADTANDSTVFSLWGLYHPKNKHLTTDSVALHWMDCHQAWIEPRDLESEFFDFYGRCMRHKIKTYEVAIEKKNTGVTLLSVLGRMQGLKTIDINRTKASGNKATRYLETQEYAASKLITLPAYGKHTKMCIEHMTKITSNNSHAHDDIADTYYDAVKLALIDKSLLCLYGNKDQRIKDDQTANLIMGKFSRFQSIRNNLFN